MAHYGFKRLISIFLIPFSRETMNWMNNNLQISCDLIRKRSCFLLTSIRALRMLKNSAFLHVTVGINYWNAVMLLSDSTIFCKDHCLFITLRVKIYKYLADFKQECLKRKLIFSDKEYFSYIYVSCPSFFLFMNLILQWRIGEATPVQVWCESDNFEMWLIRQHRPHTWRGTGRYPTT